ncbi:hypothetical protein [Massilia sp. BJB1822]|uniref:hypothetical protein n=1 Tax=Massilia sp. BJB1822 TaxID=2744470 RepID=UPI0015945EE3|nr:hypothetical protein [Massilia sp. BJB1822]NVD97764.1 hypothetical protein [Massilia sp. BJB1822]
MDISKISAIKSADPEAEQYRLCLLLDRVELELANVTRDEIADLFGVFNLNCAEFLRRNATFSRGADASRTPRLPA